MASSTVIATLDTSVRIPWVVTLLAMTLGVVVGFRLQRRHQHPPRSEPCRSHPAQKAARLLPFQLHSLLPSTSVASPSTRLPPGFALPTRKGTGRLFHCRT